MAEKQCNLLKNGGMKDEALMPASCNIAFIAKNNTVYVAADVPYHAKTAKLVSISPLGSSVITGLSINASYVSKGAAYWDISSLTSAQKTSVWTYNCIAGVLLTY